MLAAEQDYAHAVMLIEQKGQECAETIRDFLDDFNKMSGGPPKVTTYRLRRYYENRLSAIELILKVMSRDWDGPGKTKYGHDLQKMLSDVVPTLACPEIVKYKDVLVNQKYELLPILDDLSEIPNLERLWNQLMTEFNTNPKYDYRAIVASMVEIEITDDLISKFGRPGNLTPHMKKENGCKIIIGGGGRWGMTNLSPLCWSPLPIPAAAP